MCYVHNQWYDISCATLYYCPYQTCIRSKGLLQPWYKDADGVKYYEKQTAFKLRPVLNSCPIHANFITKKNHRCNCVTGTPCNHIDGVQLPRNGSNYKT